MSKVVSPDDIEITLKAKAIIDREFRFQLTHNQLAQRVGTNEKKLRSLFRICLHTTISEYQASVRIEKSKELLSETTLPIKMIADRVGYDVRSFNRQFKNITDMVPQRWRKHAWLPKQSRFLVPPSTTQESPDLSTICPDLTTFR